MFVTKKQISSVLFLLVGAAALVGSSIVVEVLFSNDQNSTQRRLTQPLRLEIESEKSYSQFLLALRIHHYRVKPRGQARFEDIFYDTSKLDLFRNGYFYRFRTEIQSNRKSKYSVRFVQRRQSVNLGSEKTDVVSTLPTSLGDAIAGGEWKRAVFLGERFLAANRLLDLSGEIGIDPGELRPVLVGELNRSRFDVSDKGRNWFELDHEIWFFHRLPDSSQTSVRFEYIVIDTRLKKQDPEILRRVQTMSELSRMVDGVRLADRAPYERGLRRLIFELF